MWLCTGIQVFPDRKDRPVEQNKIWTYCIIFVADITIESLSKVSVSQ